MVVAKLTGNWFCSYPDLGFLVNIYLLLWLCRVSIMGTLSWGMRDLAPQPVTKLRSPALGAQRPNQWTTREVPRSRLLT